MSGALPGWRRWRRRCASIIARGWATPPSSCASSASRRGCRPAAATSRISGGASLPEGGCGFAFLGRGKPPAAPWALIDSKECFPSCRSRVLRELHVRNLAVLAEASVAFGEGLNVLSGETGAGKSIVVDSLALLAGTRASTELIRSGAEALTVSGVFAPAGAEWRRVLGDAGLEVEGDEVLVRREISRSGRNRGYVNDQPPTLRLLADLAPFP